MDCTFSTVEEILALPAQAEGALWRFAQWTERLAFHRHRELELNLVARGAATYLLDDRRYTLRAGSLVWLFPEQHHILLDRTPDFVMWILIAHPALVQRVCQTDANRVLTETNPANSFCRRLDDTAFTRLHTLFALIADAKEDILRHNAGIVYALLEAWAAFGQASPEELGCRVHPAVEQIAHRLRHDAEPTSLKQFASQFGLSPSRVSELFHEQTGVSLAHYRNQQRLERFLKQYAPDNACPPTTLEAALDAGFGSYAQFYRVFSKQMGCSPTEYLRRNART